jgi:hypothetical protein
VRMTLYITMLVLLFFAASAVAQPATRAACPLSTFTNGQIVTIHGKVESAPHDMALVVPGCSQAVVLVYAGDPESQESREKLLKDESLNRFEQYTRATYGKIGGKGICVQCPKYEVKAKLTGRLDVAADTLPERQWMDKLGMLHDQSGKFVAKAGFSHPPIQKYRLVIESVSDVTARDLPKPKLSNSDDSKTILHQRGHAEGVVQQQR